MLLRTNDSSAVLDAHLPAAPGPVVPPAERRPPLRVLPSTPVPGTHLTWEQVEEIGRRLDDLRERVLADRGQHDADYIRSVIRAQRTLEAAGRGLLFAGVLPPAWLAGTACLSLAKILENMELGHNVMHGQWDRMRDPRIHSSTWEWDTVSPAEQWKHSHNYLHHTYTNVVGKDRDVGYGVLRMSEAQTWNPYYLGNPVYNALLAVFFQWGVALHDVEVEQVLAGRKSPRSAWRQLKGIGRKVRKQVTKDYLLFPALAGPFFFPVLTGNLTANLARNLWTYAIIFCGHFPDGAAQFDEDQLDDETRAQWYVRQMLGSSNLTGGPLFHLLSGNLSFQIEHHLFPDLPSNRYSEIAVEVRALCGEFGLDYSTGPLGQQYRQVLRKINRLALP